ncbi:hypothetical protein ACO22_06418 [Paracoccidioides brasiliensis]|uniref:Uncharacterized protein n=1 Tax=Paracoccidioides brasiliensis TaxID=121759 RepID=A0A1D2J7I7_PARBR|nr:hypothetical protein ACO22_06418 [Paracoccidioides brasiliensis]
MTSKYEQALARIDDAHNEDPNIVFVDCSEVPYELHYANKMTKYLEQDKPSASEILRLASNLVEEICRSCGYDSDEAERAAALVRKDNMERDEECQVLEDVACLVFLDDQFEKFEREHDEEKIVGILKKTWAKMSEKGHELALQIEMSERAKGLIMKALSS